MGQEACPGTGRGCLLDPWPSPGHGQPSSGGPGTAPTSQMHMGSSVATGTPLSPAPSVPAWLLNWFGWLLSWMQGEHFFFFFSSSPFILFHFMFFPLSFLSFSFLPSLPSSFLPPPTLFPHPISSYIFLFLRNNLGAVVKTAEAAGRSPKCTWLARPQTQTYRHTGPVSSSFGCGTHCPRVPNHISSLPS